MVDACTWPERYKANRFSVPFVISYESHCRGRPARGRIEDCKCTKSGWRLEQVVMMRHEKTQLPGGWSKGRA
jgi:hypothetical protein